MSRRFASVAGVAELMGRLRHRVMQRVAGRLPTFRPALLAHLAALAELTLRPAVASGP